MQTKRKSTIIVVGGALAVASVGYGLGTQADGGTAIAGADQTTAERDRNGGPPAFVPGGQPPGFQDLADKLGVDADKLAQALRDFRESEEGNRRDDLSAALAKALGISTDEVTKAFDQIHKKHEARFATRLANALNVDADKVQAALDKLMDGSPRPPHELAQGLADELGVSVSDVRQGAVRDASRPRRPAPSSRDAAARARVGPRRGSRGAPQGAATDACGRGEEPGAAQRCARQVPCRPLRPLG